MEDYAEYLKKRIRVEQNRQRKSVEEQKQAIESGLYPSSFSMPLSLQFELTGRCNLKCRHCYNRSGDLPNDVMTVKRWKELSTEIVNHGGIFECIISGGEPLLLGNDLFDIMDLLHNDGTVFMLISNGFLMTPKIVERLKKYRYRWIQISIDGSSTKFHDELRQVSGSWEKAVSAALMVADAGIPLAIANTLTPNSIEDLPEMARLAYECGASSLITGEIFPSGRGAINEELLLNNAQKGRLLQIIDEQQKIYAKRMLIQRSMSNRVQLEGVCDLPVTGAIIRPNGDIRLDCIAPFVMGNVANAPFYEQWQESRYCWQDERVKSYIESVDLYSGKSNLHRNHVEGDIIL
ncbi:MAG: radical SAM protein [Treponema sp.]|jgi:MoaA/NifB/PqqE/SkfB family radical SAM enzyme|nr:radical SAM protein [Treponema sp.]